MAQSTHRIQLNWADHAENEEGYWIERSTGPGEDFELIASVPANTTSYQDPGLSHSTTYYYRVSAYNIKGDSDYTQVISATTFQPNTETQLPAVWNTGDVGNPSLAGQIDYFGGTFTTNGSGEMWKNSDDFHFVYQSFTGDGEIIAQCRVKAQMAGKAVVDFVGGQGAPKGLLWSKKRASRRLSIAINLRNNDLYASFIFKSRRDGMMIEDMMPGSRNPEGVK